MKANYSRLFSMAAAASLAVMMSLSPVKMVAQAPPSPITNFPSWELASEFNDTTNPSGVWTYCSKATVTSATCATITTPLIYVAPPYGWGNDVKGWQSTSTVSIAHNVNPIAITGPATYPYPVTIPPHALGMSPSPTGEYAVVRFTAPFVGTYQVCGQFYALDDNQGGTTSDVALVRNNVSIYTAQINYSTGAKFASFSCKTFALKVGNTLDFEVGYGANGNNLFDSTGLNAVIEKIK